jgi:hypothetical protein
MFGVSGGFIFCSPTYCFHRPVFNWQAEKIRFLAPTVMNWFITWSAGTRTRVILMSALSDKEMKAYGIDKELFPFLKKPIDSATLIQTVQQTLAGPPVVLEKKGQKNDKERDDKDVQWYD